MPFLSFFIPPLCCFAIWLFEWINDVKLQDSGRKRFEVSHRRGANTPAAFMPASAQHSQPGALCFHLLIGSNYYQLFKSQTEAHAHVRHVIEVNRAPVIYGAKNKDSIFPSVTLCPQSRQQSNRQRMKWLQIKQTHEITVNISTWPCSNVRLSFTPRHRLSQWDKSLRPSKSQSAVLRGDQSQLISLVTWALEE